MKVWIFDQPDGGGRLLRQRSGHSAPPNKVQHYDNNGKNILSAGSVQIYLSKQIWFKYYNINHMYVPDTQDSDQRLL